MTNNRKDNDESKSVKFSFMTARITVTGNIPGLPSRKSVDGLRFKQAFTLLLIWALTIFLIVTTISSSSYTGIDKVDRVIYAGMMCFIFHLFLILDAFDKFHDFHRCLEKSFGGNGKNVFSISFLVIAFTDYILIQIYYIMLEEKGPHALFVTLYVMYYLSLVLMFLAWQANWEAFAFYCSEYSYMHGFMYISMLGGVILIIARWIRPSNEGDWHHHPGTAVVLNGMLNVISLLFVFLVVLAGIGIPLFAEFGQQADKMGTALAFTLLGILSLIVMLTPLAPGNIVDVCGGFVIVQILLYKEGLTFWESTAIAYFAICILHFTGACAQWFIGKQACVQAWGNSTLPVPMLAASDAVLKDANFFRVGLIGYIFMDTANGLNQGRINMAFWTQLLSEWTAFPNALPLVALGASVAVAGDESLDWTRLALPVLLLLATCWQMLGTSFGLNAMGASTDTEKYWQSREKWTLIQFFNETGYTSTKEGWKNDVYQLAKTDQEIYKGCGNDQCLYAKISEVHKLYLKEREALLTEAERLDRYQTYNEDISRIREEHIIAIQKTFEFGEKDSWLIYKAPPRVYLGWFDRKEHLMQKTMIVCVLVICFLVSIIGIYNKISMQSAVKNGVGVLDDIEGYAWVGFILFILLEIVYFHAQVYSGFMSIGSICSWFYGGCHFEQEIETRFDTPTWEL